MVPLRFRANYSEVQYVPAIAQTAGRFFLVSGPSGTGKGTLLQRLYADPQIRERITPVPSVTTRQPRPGETRSRKAAWVETGQSLGRTLCRLTHHLLHRGPACPPMLQSPPRQYQFLSEKDFLKRKQQGNLFQWAHFDGQWYGTTVDEVLSKFRQGKIPVFELSSRDALKIKALYPTQATTVFVAPPAPELDTLRQRLIKRGTNSPESIAERLHQAQGELALKPQFDTVIVNGENQLEQAVSRFKNLILQQGQGLRFSGRFQPPAA